MKRYDPELDNPYMDECVEGDYVKTKDVVEFLKEIKRQLDILDNRMLDNAKDEIKYMIKELS